MSRVLVIGSDTQVSREIGDALCAAGFTMEYSAGDADALHRLRMRSFGVVITSPDSAVDEDLALLEEIRVIRPRVNASSWLITALGQDKLHKASGNMADHQSSATSGRMLTKKIRQNLIADSERLTDTLKRRFGIL